MVKRKNKFQNLRVLSLVVIPAFLLSFTPVKQKEKKVVDSMQTDYVSYADDVSFMEEYTDIIQLTDSSGKSKVAISAALQGRVMTSSSSGADGRSYGWINREHFTSGDTLEHINVFGGEERFWLGPEGGQFSIFFKEGSEFTLDNWYTPKSLDIEPFEVKTVLEDEVIFTKNTSLVNYSGFHFDIGIERTIKLLSAQTTFKELGIGEVNGVDAVTYKTTNVLVNKGQADWKKETGLLSIWLLGMFNPSPSTSIVIPYRVGDEDQLGTKVNDDYFGKVPAERLIVKEGVMYFSADGKYRSKIGLSPQRAKNVAGAYDAANGILTVIKHVKPKEVKDYVNSAWELQEQPYAGDVMNAYNDGAPEPGKKPLGPFFELESSSPALELKAGQSGSHSQITCHFKGQPEKLSMITKALFGVNIEEISSIFL
jgi:hypothetical protein